jgi:phage terminase large subunit
MNATKTVPVTPVFQRNAWAYQSNKQIICNEGGSRSGKTYSIIQLLIAIATNEKFKRISIVSHSLPHIKRGALRDFRLIMESLHRWHEENWSATNFIYTFSNGSYIELFGLEDEGKARGPGRDILFVNEANLISKSLFDQLAMRTTGKIFADWNPAEFSSWVYEMADHEDSINIHSTYLDNIYNLSDLQVRYIESYRNLPDDFMWKVYGLGLRGAAKELIYTNWKMIKELPGKGEVVYGLDFGYTAPCAMVKVELFDESIYVEEILYQSGLTITELCSFLKGLNLGRSEIFADAAEPKSIEEIYRYGMNVKPADKDVWAGILKVKSMPLYIVASSENLKTELNGYKWKKDKAENVLEEPVKMNDHLLDALRYAVFTKLITPKRFVGVIKSVNTSCE